MGGKIRSGSKKHSIRNDATAKAQFNDKPKLVPKKATKGVYKGIDYDSLEELAFLQWASDLIKAGYIDSIERAESFLLCDGLVINYAEQLKTKSKPMQQGILHGHSYTPEFRILWTKKGRETFVDDVHESKKHEKLLLGRFRVEESRIATETYIEIKPVWDQNNMERLFKVNQKWMWQKHGIFVNLVKCPLLFAETFTPQEYLITPSGFKRKIKWKIRSLYQYLNTKK